VEKNKFESTHVKYSPRTKPIKNKGENFGQQKITFDDTPLFFPAGMEKLFLLMYFILLPYITGLIFLFFYVGEGKTDLFLSLNEDSSFILTWAIGYEIIAVLMILYIIKMAIFYSVDNARKGAQKHFRIP